MKKGVIVFVSALMLAGCSASFSSRKTDTTGNAAKQTAKNTVSTTASAVTTTTEAASSVSDPAEQTEESASAEYHVGDTWTVEGQWSLTLESVEKTDERNPYTDEREGEPAEVYSLKYTYENLGYTNDILEGLYLRLDRGTIIDSTGLLGDSYPLSGSGNAKYTPVGAKCQAQSFIALKNPGGFRIEMLMYDGNKEKQTAVFVFE